MVQKELSRGFTLIEVLLVIAILAILAGVVIVAINPSKQFGEAQNAQRRNDVIAVMDALHQYSIDNAGFYPGDIPSGLTSCLEGGVNICQAGISCDGVMIDEIIEEGKYLTELPNDPSAATDDITGYYVYRDGTNGRISVCAPFAYNDEEISVTR